MPVLWYQPKKAFLLWGIASVGVFHRIIQTREVNLLLQGYLLYKIGIHSSLCKLLAKVICCKERAISHCPLVTSLECTRVITITYCWHNRVSGPKAKRKSLVFKVICENKELHIHFVGSNGKGVNKLWSGLSIQTPQKVLCRPKWGNGKGCGSSRARVNNIAYLERLNRYLACLYSLYWFSGSVPQEVLVRMVPLIS